VIVARLPCGCCEPSAQLTPLAVSNRAGLSAIAYRIGTYSSFRASMLEEIARTPELAALTTRRDDDYAITTLDLWAAVADVLTFYQERYANEAFLRTAVRRESVSRLAHLIDYSLRPGVAALAWLAFSAEEEKVFRVPVGLRVQSVPGQDEQPQTFETLEQIVADARLNRARVLPAPVGVNPLAPGATEALLYPDEATLATAVELAKGDRILVFSTGSAGSVEALTVDDVRYEEERITLAWEAPIRGTWDLSSAVRKGGRTFRLFGHNAPVSTVTPSTANVPGGIRWSLASTDYGYPASGLPTARLLLDGRYENVASGTQLLVDDEAGATTLVTVTAVETGPARLAGIADTVTRLTVTPSVPAAVDRRRVSIYELSGPPIRFWGYAYPNRLAGGAVFLPGTRISGSTIEIGRTIVRRELQPGVRIRADEIAPGRTVLIGDAEHPPAAARVEAAGVIGATVVCEPTAGDATTARELGLDAESALAVAGVASAPFPSSLALTSPTPRLRVVIGELKPRTITLSPSPTNVVSAATALQAALVAAGPEPVFANARVLWLEQRLLVVPGGEGDLAFLPAEDDATTIRELGLDAEHAVPTRGLLSAPLTAPIGFASAAPEIAVTIGPVGPRRIAVLDSGSVKGVAYLLNWQLYLADAAPGFRSAWVLVVDDRLLILPGPFGTKIAEYLRLDLELDAPLQLDPDTAYLLGNVARASHGETVRGEVLGSGDASASFQRFALKRRPLTYVPSAKGGGAESSLAVTVSGVRWSEVPGLYSRGGKAEVYAVRESDEGTAIAQFGNNETGAALPTGKANVQATYRVGAGLAGRVRAETLTTALDRPPGLKDVTNPLAARGGADPETVDYARENAPATVRTFGRAVALRDFEDLVRSDGEVAKAQAIWVWDGLDRAIHLTVAGQQGGAFEPEDLRRIGAALTAARDPNYRLLLANHAPLPIVFRATIDIDPRYVQSTVTADARAALLDALSFDTVRLGTPVHLSDLYRVLQDVEGVVAVDVDELQPKRPPDRERPNIDRLADGTPAPLQPHVRVYAARPDTAHAGVVFPAELASIEDERRDVALAARGGIEG
jgi:hypothetical protein